MEGATSVNLAGNPEKFKEFEYLGWQGAVERYHGAWRGLTSQTAGPMLDALGVSSGTSFLDVASGPGYIAAEAVRRGGQAIALDFSPGMIAKGQQAYSGIRFKLGDAEDLPFQEESFDALAMNFGMLHLGDPQRAVKEAFRVLKPGGRFGFTVWTRPAEAQGFSLILKAVEEHGEHVAIPHGPDFFYYSRPEECRIALTTAGFASPNVMLLDLEWVLPSTADVFTAFIEGTARTGGLLRRQGAASQQAIRQKVESAAGAFVRADGAVHIPMPAVLAVATKH
jgi:SAM-dependent methyltransferase